MKTPDDPYGGGRALKEGESVVDAIAPDTEELSRLLGVEPDFYTLGTYFPILQPILGESLQHTYFSTKVLHLFTQIFVVYDVTTNFGEKQKIIKNYLSGMSSATAEDFYTLLGALMTVKYDDKHVLIGVPKEYFKLYACAEHLQKNFIERNLLATGEGIIKKSEPIVETQKDIPSYMAPEDYFADVDRENGDVYDYVTYSKRRPVLLHATSDQINELLTYMRAHHDKAHNLAQTLDLLTELYTEKKAEEENPGGVLQ